MACIFILGASGAGTSTLGAAVALDLLVPHFDVDKFYWLPTDPPFTTPRPVEERISVLTRALDAHASWVLEGSTLKWGDTLIPRYDLVVFMTVSPTVRMERLRRRERARYGQRIEPGGDMVEQSAAFFAWAAAYDTAGLEQRSRVGHEAWLAGISAPLLRLDGEQPIDTLREAVLSAVRSLPER
jgi:adenylate kinase family enzyme